MVQKNKTKEYIFNAKNKKLGRLATEIAHILQGKDDPSYDPSKIANTKIVINNIEDLEISGKKSVQKKYYRHAGRLGHLKEKVYEDVFKNNPEWVIKHAVRLMLPKNRLSKKRLANLVIENNKSIDN